MMKFYFAVKHERESTCSKILEHVKIEAWDIHIALSKLGDHQLCGWEMLFARISSRDYVEAKHD